VILKNDTPDFGFKFATIVTDAEGEVITDEAVLATLVKEVESTDGEVVGVLLNEGKSDEGMIHVGRSGSSTLFGRVWGSQAAKDAGADPLHVSSEVFTITTGDPAAITEAGFHFDIESQGDAEAEADE
jgi:hypothetical protein